jgi:hypothetical protein
MPIRIFAQNRWWRVIESYRTYAEARRFNKRIHDHYKVTYDPESRLYCVIDPSPIKPPETPDYFYK